jgi:hypothetical protein
VSPGVLAGRLLCGWWWAWGGGRAVGCCMISILITSPAQEECRGYGCGDGGICKWVLCARTDSDGLGA